MGIFGKRDPKPELPIPPVEPDLEPGERVIGRLGHTIFFPNKSNGIPWDHLVVTSSGIRGLVKYESWHLIFSFADMTKLNGPAAYGYAKLSFKHGDLHWSTFYNTTELDDLIKEALRDC